MVKQSVCMQCRRWSKGWHDRVNEPYDQFYCTWCWARFMGQQMGSVRGKDTVWWREQWKAATNAPRHHSSPLTCKKYWRRQAEGEVERSTGKEDEDQEDEEDGTQDEVQEEQQQEEEDEGQDESEEESEDADELEEEENPKWVQQAVNVLWKHGGGNMNWTTFQQKCGLPRGVSKHAILSRPEFESCGKKNCSVRLQKWVRLQRYA